MKQEGGASDPMHLSITYGIKVKAGYANADLPVGWIPSVVVTLPTPTAELQSQDGQTKTISDKNKFSRDSSNLLMHAEAVYCQVVTSK